MTHFANLVTQDFSGGPVEADGHPLVTVAKKVKADNGSLAAGLILSMDENGLLIPAVEETVDLGEGDGTATDFEEQMTIRNLAPGSVKISDGAASGAQELADDGHGSLYGDGTGTVNYRTGLVSVSFTAAPANGLDTTVTAKTQPYGVCAHLVDTTREGAALVYIHGGVRKDALLIGAVAPDAEDLALLENIGVYPQ